MNVVVLPLLLTLNAISQTGSDDRPNLIGLELLGRGGLYSLNYERSVTPGVGLGIGFALLGPGSGFFKRTESERSERVIVPMYVSWHPLGEDHFLYLAGGLTLVSEEIDGLSSRDRRMRAAGTLTVGRRFRLFQKVLFRPSLTRVFMRGSPDGFWPGFSVGFTF